MNQLTTTNDSRSTGTVDLVLGPYRSGKTLKLAQSILDCCYGKPFTNAIVIVPSKRYLSLFNRRLLQVLGQRCPSDTESGALGFIGLKTVSFYETCETVLRQAGITFKIIPNQLRVALLGQVLGDLKKVGELSTLQTIADFSGAHTAIVDLIDEFQRSGLSPSDVLSRLSETASVDSRYMELAKVYRQYWQELDNLGYIDQKGLAFKAREALTSGINLSFDFIAVDGFDRFNPLQLSVLHGLSRHAKEMKICFDYLPPEKDLEHEYVWKQASYEELKYTFADQFVSEISGSDNESGKQVAAIETLRTLDRFFEMDEIARRIKKAIVRSQIAPDQILVVARDLKAYKGTIDIAFEQAGLNYFIDESVQLNSLPVVQFLIRLLNLPSNNFVRLDVVSCLRSPYFNLNKFRLSRQDIDWLDTWSLKARVVSSIEQWSELFTEEIDSNKDAEFRTKHNALSAALTKTIDIFKRLQPLPSNGSFLIDWVSFTEDVIDEFLALPHREEHADPFEHWQEQRAIIEFKKILAMFVQEECILGHDNKSGSTDVSFTYERYLKKLEHTLSNANFPSIPRAGNCVTICSADLAPNRNFDEVFIAGMIEGEFPRKISRSGFTSTDEVACWASFGINIENPRFNPSFEKALFSSLIKRARKGVYLSYPSYELTGEEIVPSFLFKKVAQDVEEHTFAIPFLSGKLEPVSVRDAFTGHFWFMGTSSSLPETISSRPDCSHFQTLIDEPLAVAHGRVLGGIDTIYNGCLVDSVAAGIVKIRLPEYWSASRLSSYGRCPFQYWVSHVLETEPYEEPIEGIPFNILGETYHHALELFYREMNSNDLKLGSCEKSKAESIFNSAVEAALQQLENKKEIRQGEFWQYEKKEIVYKLKRFFEHEWQRALNDTDVFYPLLTEVGFGLAGEENPPLAISRTEHSLEPILIRGRIDRIDISMQAAENGQKLVRVVDYKTGATPITAKDAFAGRNLQLPLYALAVERSIIPGSEVVAGQYLSIGSGEPVGQLNLGRFEKIDNARLLDHVQFLIKNIVREISQGNFQIDPSNSKVCRQCQHQTICRIKELDSSQPTEEAESLS